MAKQCLVAHHSHYASRISGLTAPVIIAAVCSALCCACFAQGFSSNGNCTSNTAYQIVRTSAIASFTGDVLLLDRLYKEAKTLERPEPGRVALPYQLHDNILALQAACTPDRISRFELARRILKEHPDALLKPGILTHVQSDELNRASRFRWEIYYNHIASMFNRLSKSTSQLVSGRLQPLFRFGLDLPFLYQRFFKITPRERKILVLSKTYLRKHPEDPRVETLSRHIERLEKKRRAQQAILAAAQSKRLRAAGRLDDSLFYIQQACHLFPKARKFEKQRLNILRDTSRAHRRQIDTVTVLDGERFQDASNEETLYRRLLYALARNDQADITRAALTLAQHVPTSKFADEAAYVHDLFTADSANPQQLTERMHLLAKQYPQTNMAQHAEEVAQSPFINLLAAYDRENARYHHRLATYLLLGVHTNESRLYIATSEAMPQQNKFAEYMGIICITDIPMRALKAALANPVSKESVIDRAIFYVNKYPASLQAKRLSAKVARYYENDARGEEALYYYALADQLTTQCITRVENTCSRHLYALAHRVPSPEPRVSILREILTLYPDSKLLKKVKKELAAIERTPIIEQTIPKTVLQATPILWNQKGLCLQQKLFDGDRRNSEMTEEGVTIFSDNQAHYFVYGDSHPRTLEIDAETRRILSSQIAELNYQQRIQLEIQARSKRPRFPLEVTGSIGEGGVEAYPTLRKIEYKEEDLPLYK